MKKLKTLFYVASATVLLSSCVKDWTCSCTSTAGGASYNSSEVYHTTKKTAQAACDSNTASFGSTGTTCTLK
jgi:hypothetical protein